MLRFESIDEPRETAFNIAFDTGDDFLAFMRSRENCGELRAMHGFLGFVMSGTNMGARNHDMDMLAGETVDWEALGEGLVVDMGGAYGHVCASIARKNPKLRFIVQDLPQIIGQARKEILNTTEGDASVASRISFMEHDFLHPQTVTNADVFMFRFVIHDWSDKYVLRILENLLHAMKPTARIVIMDYVLGAAGSMPKVVERLERTMDIVALSIIAGKERTSLDWQKLITRLGGRLEIRSIHTSPQSAFGLVVLGLGPVSGHHDNVL
ncbi:hypothetical protein DL768_000528 [Monosporascus sp. mg162]|nr:hypothetical protein DL768_000528 [Monosporascus sp. mg162]